MSHCLNKKTHCLYAIVRLAGLDAGADYRIEELGEVYGGDELMSFGLSVKLKECDASSVTLTLKKVHE